MMETFSQKSFLMSPLVLVINYIFLFILLWTKEQNKNESF